ncbi:MAG: bifunctional folylpolyglutamate synthase/dihydrofolate synthase, partial [Flavobacteriales bacterium]|nr:bifunctional folylpolyglutamate synthase/dihydrofolate synthase [Flavobacteriales bacterium]
FCAADIPRALPEEILAEKAQALGLRGETFTAVKKAFEAAHLYAKPEDCIYVGGSVFVVAEVI